jgi:hypothetical protein
MASGSPFVFLLAPSVQISNVTSGRAFDRLIKWTLLACKPKNLNTLSLYLFYNSYCNSGVASISRDIPQPLLDMKEHQFEENDGEHVDIR